MSFSLCFLLEGVEMKVKNTNTLKEIHTTCRKVATKGNLKKKSQWCTQRENEIENYFI